MALIGGAGEGSSIIYPLKVQTDAAGELVGGATEYTSGLMALGPFNLADIDASAGATAIPMATADGTPAASYGIVMPKAGVVMGISLSQSTAFTTLGGVTFTVQKDGVDTAIVLTPALVLTDQSTLKTKLSEGVAYAVNDKLALVYDSGAGMLPDNSMDVSAWIWVV